ncbi:hypothetical protein B0H14DRAFT_2981697, partial [Mycena olivaceomarginata]
MTHALLFFSFSLSALPALLQHHPPRRPARHGHHPPQPPPPVRKQHPGPPAAREQKYRLPSSEGLPLPRVLSEPVLPQPHPSRPWQKRIISPLPRPRNREQRVPSVAPGHRRMAEASI